jgi:hypothetical protein
MHTAGATTACLAVAARFKRCRARNLKQEDGDKNTSRER